MAGFFFDPANFCSEAGARGDFGGFRGFKTKRGKVLFGEKGFLANEGCLFPYAKR